MDQLDSFSSDSESCKVGYLKEGLENKEHTIVVESIGPSPQAPETSEGGLDVESILSVVFRKSSHNIWQVDLLQNNSVTSEDPPPDPTPPPPSSLPRWATFLHSISTLCWLTPL